MQKKFKIVRTAHKVFEKLLGSTSVEEVSQQMGYLQDQYKDLAKNTLDYSDLSTQLAYVYRFLPGHAALIYRALSENSNFSTLLSMENWNVLALGGGPGTELLGLTKFAYMNNVYPTVKLYTVDRCQEWKDVRKEIANECSEHIDIERVVLEIDLCAQFEKLKSALNTADLVTFSYCGSELNTYPDRGMACFQFILKNMKKGAVLLYLDNSGEECRQGIVRACNSMGISFRYKWFDEDFFPVDETPLPYNKYRALLNGIRSSGKFQWIVIST